MTFLTSLSKRGTGAKTLLFPFTSSFGVGLITINALILFCIVFLPFTGMDNLIQLKISNPNMLYCLLPASKTFSYFSFLMLQATISAVILFGFMLNKRASTAYMSLPVSRARLFWSRYSAGVIAIILPNIIYLTYMLIININVFGVSAPLFQAYAFILCGTFATLLIVYSVITTICLLVGTIPEALVFSYIIIFGMEFLAMGMTSICSYFLHGSEFGRSTVFYDFLSPDFTYYVTNNAPVESFVRILQEFGVYGASAADFHIGFLSKTTNGKGVADLLIWFTIAGAVSFLGYRAIKRYKSENSGSLGICAPLNIIATSFAVFLTFCTICSGSSWPAWEIIAVGLIMMLLVFILCRFLLTLSIKRAIAPRGFRRFGIMLAGIIVICGICVSGMFGYSSYQPDIGDIKGATITYTGAPDFISGESRETGNYYSANRSADKQDIFVRRFYSLQYTSEEDIEKVLELHKKLIDSGPGLFSSGKQRIDDMEKDRFGTQVHIAYGLTDGSTAVNRLYKSVTPEFLMDMLALDETDAVKENIKQSFEMPPDTWDTINVKITDFLFENEHSLDTAYNEELFAAIGKDVEALTLEGKYFPEGTARAIISYPRQTGSMDAYAAYTYAISSYIVINSGGYEGPDMLYLGSTENIHMYITDGYVNTLAFLEGRGFIGEADNQAEIAEVYVERFRANPYYSTQAVYFRSYAAGNYENIDKSLKLDNYGDILSKARSNYYAAGGGYLVKVKAEKWVTLFLPEEDAPEYLKKLG